MFVDDDFALQLDYLFLLLAYHLRDPLLEITVGVLEGFDLRVKLDPHALPFFVVSCQLCNERVQRGDVQRTILLERR